jgi:hypothetical protein
VLYCATKADSYTIGELDMLKEKFVSMAQECQQCLFEYSSPTTIPQFAAYYVA